MFVSAATYLDALILLLGDNSDRSRSMVKEFLATAEKQDGRRDITGGDDDLISAYKSLIKSAIADRISQENETSANILLLKIRSVEIFKSYPLERDILTDILTGSEKITAHQIDSSLKKLRNMLLLAEIDGASRKMFAQSMAVSGMQDMDEQEIEIAKLKGMLDKSLKSIDQRQSNSEVKASETFVSLSDPESVKRALNTFMDRNVTGVIKTGLQGLNRALGTRGGFGLGETVVFAASSHNYKSGMLVSIMIWTALYNKIKVAPGKRAFIYFVSLENEVSQNLMDVFKTVYCRVEQRQVDINAMSADFITRWIIDFFGKFDIEVIMDRYEPHEFSYGKFVKRFNAFADMGYQMVLFDLDYMSEARGIDPGDTMSTQGQIQLIKENYTKFMNHAKTQGYLLATGHQLTKKAEESAAQDRYAVKKFNPSMIADSSDVHRTVDILFYLQLGNNVDNVKFLMVQNRKNRGSKDTPESHKFFAYPFTEFGIQDDLEGLGQFVQDIDAWGNKGATDDAIVEAAMF